MRDRALKATQNWSEMHSRTDSRGGNNFKHKAPTDIGFDIDKKKETAKYGLFGAPDEDHVIPKE